MSQDKRQRYALTGNTNSINVIGDDTGLFQDSIELRSGTMKYYWVKSNTVKERKTKSKLVEIIKDSTTNFDDSEFRWMRRVRGRRENPEISLDLTFCSNRVQQTCYCVLEKVFSPVLFEKTLCSLPYQSVMSPIATTMTERLVHLNEHHFG